MSTRLIWSGRLWQQVFSVDEAATGLAKALGCFLLSETVHVYALLSDTRGQASKITVGRDKAKAIETTGMEKVHCVDNQSNVRGILATGVREVLVRLDSMRGENVGPGFQSGA